MKPVADNPIGGYFALELRSLDTAFHPQAIGFQSARAAFHALLQSGKPSRIWMPWYICDSMLEPLRSAGVPIARYAIDAGWSMRDRITLAKDEWLFYVNYFGLCDPNIDDLLDIFPKNQIVIDHAQAFFSPPRDCLANIYSPRKFFGVPDGGYLVTSLSVAEPDEIDTASAQRAIHLIKRLAGEPESGYADFQAAEKSLIGQSPKQMSILTRKLLASIDYQQVRAARIDNYTYLHHHLAQHNSFRLRRLEMAVPLCYPFRGVTMHREKQEFIRNRIYLPTYWPELSQIENMPQQELDLANVCLFLPCDQRLTKHDLDKVIKIALNG